MHVHNRNTHFSCFTCHWEISPTTTFCHSFSSGMPWTDKSKPSTTKWLGKNGHFTCSSIPAGVQEIIMHSKGKRKRERETNLKVNICKYMHLNYCWCVRSVWSSGHDHTLLHVRAQVWILTGPTVVSTFFSFPLLLFCFFIYKYCTVIIISAWVAKQCNWNLADTTMKKKIK